MRKVTKFLLLCLCFFSLGVSLTFPIFDNKSIVQHIFSSKEKELDPLGASYPDFGCKTAYTSLQSIYNIIRYQYAQPAANGKILSLTAYIKVLTAGTSYNVKGALYTYNSSSDVGSLLAVTEQKTLNNNAWAWITFNFTTNYAVVSGTNYYMAVWGGGLASGCHIGYTTGGNGGSSSLTYGAWPDPLTGETALSRLYSMYVTYDRSPTQSSPSPTNSSTGISLTPTCNITIADPDGDAMTVNFYENSTGSYVLRQTNSSCANGTYRWTDAQATSYGLKYYWKVYVNDGKGYNVSAWYCFTTQMRLWYSLFSGYEKGGNATIPWSPLFSGYFTGGNITNYKSLFQGYETGGNETASYHPLFSGWFSGGNVSKLIITDVYPVNGSTAAIRTSIAVTVEQIDGLAFNISWFGSDDNGSSWFSLGSTIGVTNGTWGVGFWNASILNKTYYWRVEIVDTNLNYANETYHYTTANLSNASIISITIDTSNKTLWLAIGIFAGFMIAITSRSIFSKKKQ